MYLTVPVSSSPLPPSLHTAVFGDRVGCLGPTLFRKKSLSWEGNFKLCPREKHANYQNHIRLCALLFLVGHTAAFRIHKRAHDQPQEAHNGLWR